MKLRYWFSAWPVLVSCAIGAAVSSAFNLEIGDPWAESALKGALAGTLIGLAAECAFIATARWINRKPAYSFIAVILVIAVGTPLCGRLLIAERLTPALMVSIVAVSEAVGIAATTIFWRTSKRMNDRLATTKKHFAP